MKTKQILLVDDSPFFLKIIATILKRSGCDLLTAGDGNEALEIVNKTPPDVILMDYYMKGMSGSECCKSIKLNPATKDIPVIMVTSAGKNEDMENCSKAGCDDYITKPVEKIVLLEKVKKYLKFPVRAYKRAPICIPALYYFDNEEYSGIIFAISEGGLFIKGERILDKESSLKIKFDIPHIARQIEIEGEVVWNSEERNQRSDNIGPGFGVRFTAMDREGLEAIKTYVNLGNYLV